MNIDYRLPISDVPTAIRGIVRDQSTAPSYRQVYAAVLDGSIPAERIKGDGMWRD